MGTVVYFTTWKIYYNSGPNLFLVNWWPLTKWHVLWILHISHSVHNNNSTEQLINWLRWLQEFESDKWLGSTWSILLQRLGNWTQKQTENWGTERRREHRQPHKRKPKTQTEYKNEGKMMRQVKTNQGWKAGGKATDTRVGENYKIKEVKLNHKPKTMTVSIWNSLHTLFLAETNEIDAGSIEGWTCIGLGLFHWICYTGSL